MKKRKFEKKSVRRIRSVALKILLTMLIIFVVAVSVVGLVFAVYIDRNIETEIDESLFLQVGSDGTTKLYYYDFKDRENRSGELNELEYEELYGGYKCIYAEFDEIPQELINAFISIVK